MAGTSCGCHLMGAVFLGANRVLGADPWSAVLGFWVSRASLGRVALDATCRASSKRKAKETVKNLIPFVGPPFAWSILNGWYRGGGYQGFDPQPYFQV